MPETVGFPYTLPPREAAEPATTAAFPVPEPGQRVAYYATVRSYSTPTSFTPRGRREVRLVVESTVAGPEMRTTTEIRVRTTNARLGGILALMAPGARVTVAGTVLRVGRRSLGIAAGTVFVRLVGSSVVIARPYSPTADRSFGWARRPPAPPRPPRPRVLRLPGLPSNHVNDAVACSCRACGA